MTDSFQISHMNYSLISPKKFVVLCAERIHSFRDRTEIFGLGKNTNLRNFNIKSALVTLRKCQHRSVLKSMRQSFTLPLKTAVVHSCVF
jgi:hypothetical protein